MLTEYTQKAIAAYNNCSFDPDKIGKRIIADYSAELKKDLEELGDNPGNYERKYKAYFLSWIHSTSNCASWFVCGPAKFPVEKMKKRRQSEENHYQEFRAWRDRYFSAVNRIPTLAPEDDLELQLIKLDKLIIKNEEIKAANKILTKCTKDKTPAEEVIKLLGSTKIKAQDLQDFFTETGKYPSLGSCATSIRELTKRIEILKVRIARKESFQDIVFDGGKITIENDRACIYHDEKPAREITEKLKSRGFRWSPNWSCWCRKHTGQAIYDAKLICGVKNA